MDTNSQKIIWNIEVLPTKTKKALLYLSQKNWLKKSKWYLAGGTALALQVKHRQSLDLDFFLPQKTFSPRIVTNHFKTSDWQPRIIREGTIYGDLFGAQVSFIAYPFFVFKQSPNWYGSVRVLTPRDIIMMKIIAISQRGRKRDFIDLYWYCLNQGKLEEVLRLLPNQYPIVVHEYHHILKSLVYFEDAEKDPMPKLFFKISWLQVKKFFQNEVKSLSRKLL